MPIPTAAIFIMETSPSQIGGTTAGDVQALLSRYVGQLVRGCENAECTATQCFTGRLNTTPRPIRRLTSRAARAIAFAICSGPRPKSYLCPYYDCGGQAPSVQPDAELDDSSLVQQLIDTPTVQHFYVSSDPTYEPQNVEFKQLQDFHQKLYPLHERSAHLPGREFVTNTILADVLGHCLDWLLKKAPLTRLAPWYWVDAEVISPGNAYPQFSSSKPADNSYNTWLAILDVLDHAPYMRLLRSVCNVVAKRCVVEHLAKPDGWCGPRANICTMIASRLVVEDAPVEKGVALTIWLKKLFAQQWNANPVIQSKTCYAILELIRGLHDELVSLSYTRTEIFVFRLITLHVSVTEISQAWVSRSEKDAPHVLSYRFLFSDDQLYLIFRSINHLVMSQAHRLVLQARRVREKVAEVGAQDLNEQQIQEEENCLLLSVSRNNMLKDTFDQLWHRRKGELRRPLRVRLGTVGELQVGQDLGGVQMEFFNLLCRQLLDEQADMFTTEARTGCSYFKAGSSQPLVFFRHFGTLLALAMYNGIALPITMPTAFYHMLVEGVPPDGSDLHILEDGWPEIAKSLRGLSDEDLEGLDFTFDMEANGLHMSVLSPRQDTPEGVVYPSQKGCLVSPILQVVAHHPAKFEVDNISWAGWTLQKTQIDAEEVTSANKSRYIREKAFWFTYTSVAPQLFAVLEGFRSADLFPHHALKHLFTARTLKAYTEGTDHLDIKQLRATTTYTDYDDTEDYIQCFWREVAGWSHTKQKQLLKFVTAAERIPISGTGQLVFKIRRADNPDLLPTSHTCFGMLDLPRYESTKVMSEKLSLALRYGSEGFGMG